MSLSILRLLLIDDSPDDAALLVRAIEHGGYDVVRERIDTAAALSAALAHLAYHDALTDLPNRALLHDRLAQATRVSHREGTTLALLLLDLNGFKEINDTLGHHAGDLVLQSVASRIRATLRDADTVAR